MERLGNGQFVYEDQALIKRVALSWVNRVELLVRTDPCFPNTLCAGLRDKTTLVAVEEPNFVEVMANFDLRDLHGRFSLFPDEATARRATTFSSEAEGLSLTMTGTDLNIVRDSCVGKEVAVRLGIKCVALRGYLCQLTVGTDAGNLNCFKDFTIKPALITRDLCGSDVERRSCPVIWQAFDRNYADKNYVRRPTKEETELFSIRDEGSNVWFTATDRWETRGYANIVGWKIMVKKNDLLILYPNRELEELSAEQNKS